MKTTSKIPNYTSIRKLSERVLLSIDQPVLPVKIMPLVNVLIKGDLIVHSFNQYTEIENLDYGVFLNKAHSKDGTLRYFPEDDFYVLLYNKNVQRDRKAWTIAHELGHYYAKHHIKMKKYLKSHKEIPEELDTAFEQEANCFARELLAPTSLMQLVMAELNVTDFVAIYTISRCLFRLSQEASFNVATSMRKLDHPYYSPKLYLRYQHALDDFLNYTLDHNNFYALIRRYQGEVDARDNRRRKMMSRVNFWDYY